MTTLATKQQWVGSCPASDELQPRQQGVHPRLRRASSLAKASDIHCVPLSVPLSVALSPRFSAVLGGSR